MGSTFIHRHWLAKFTNWNHVGGHDNILFTPNGKLHRLLTRLAFTNLLHPFSFYSGPKNNWPGNG